MLSFGHGLFNRSSGHLKWSFFFLGLIRNKILFVECFGHLDNGFVQNGILPEPFNIRTLFGWFINEHFYQENEQRTFHLTMDELRCTQTRKCSGNLWPKSDWIFYLSVQLMFIEAFIRSNVDVGIFYNENYCRMLFLLTCKCSDSRWKWTVQWEHKDTFSVNNIAQSEYAEEMLICLWKAFHFSVGYAVPSDLTCGWM